VASDAALRTASDQWDLLQEPAERRGEVRRRDPNWSMLETARLCHGVADQRNATALRKLYQRESNLSELDRNCFYRSSTSIYWIFSESGVEENLGASLHIDGIQYCIYGDGAYVLDVWI
jgi:hypothetical protein